MEKDSKTKITFILVHGGNMSTDTWNKIAKSDDYPSGCKLGGKIWNTIIPGLKTKNYSVFAPTLKDEHKSNLSDHIEEIYRLIIRNDLKNIILVGHSYGGMVITGVAARIPEKINCLIYIDAALPDPGQSLFDLISSGGCDPLSFVGLEPAAPYIEKIQFDAQKIKSLPKTYILCTKSEFAVVTHVAKDKIEASKENWNYIEIPASHVPMADMPEKLLEILLEIAKNNF